MADAIGYDELVHMLRGAAEKVTTHRRRLTDLDAAIGDGDHGKVMRKVMALLAKAVGESRSRDMASVLNDVAWAVLSAGDGAAVPLFGAWFMGMAEAVAEKASLDAPALADVFEAALASVRKQTGAEPGDKTLLDALVPAVETFREAADAGQDVPAAIAKAAEAAERGAQATETMPARIGRAKALGEASVGTVDPGAVSAALMFRGFADALAAGET